MHARVAVSLSIVLFLGATSGTAVRAADVPEGVELAEEQVLHRGNGLEPESLDPHRSRGDASGHVLRDLYEGLTAEAPDGTVIPGVAKEWDLKDGGTRYVFRLRESARWSNGDPVTAEDFAYALRRALDPATGSPYAQVLSPIRNAAKVLAGDEPPKALGVRAVDDHTLAVELEAPTPYFLGLLTHPSTFPVHRESIEEHGDRFTRPGNHVTNGAYRLSDWAVHSHITLKRNPHYWNDDETVIDKVVFHPIENESAELKRFRAGDLDVTYTIPHARYDWLTENLSAELRIAPFLSTYFYGFNLTREPFRDSPELRAALSMAIDREILTEKVLGVGEVPAYGWVPPGVDNYTTQTLAYADWPDGKRIETAKRLYREAGYGDDNPLEIEVRFNTGEIHRRLAAAIASMWKKHLGVKTNLVNEEWKVFLQTRQAMEQTEVFRSGWVGDYNDPYTFAEVMHSGHGINDFGYDNAAYDRLLASASVETDLAKRRALLEKAERMMLADHPIIPLYYYVSKHLVKQWVGGWEDNVMDHHYTRHLFIRKH